MAKKTSRRVYWMEPIQNASTKFALVREKAGVNTGGVKYFGSRIFKTRDQQGGLIQASGFYMRKYGRESALKQSEITQRINFRDGIKWANNANMDLSAVSWNQEQYLIVKNDRTKKCGSVPYTNENNILGYLRAYAIKTLNMGEELPENYRLPAAQ